MKYNMDGADYILNKLYNCTGPYFWVSHVINPRLPFFLYFITRSLAHDEILVVITG